MSQILFANNATSTLAAPLTTTSTTVLLASGTGSLFPNPGAGQYFVMTLTDAATKLINEIVWVTARAGDSLTVVRGQESTVPQDWAAGDLAANLNTAGVMAALEAGVSGYANINVYQIVGGSQQVSVNGAAYTTVGATAFTYTSSGAALVSMKGGGASGGSTGTTSDQAAAGGGEGAFLQGLLTGQTPGSTETISVGLGGVSPAGTGTAAGANGNNGGATTFGSSFTAGGGQAGSGSNSTGAATAGGLGGTASGGIINDLGGSGEDGFGKGGRGGGSGAGVGRTSAVPELDGASLGSGGGGAYQGVSVRGGAGQNGYVIVRY